MFIGHTTISQSRSHFPSSFALFQVSNLTMPTDPIGDMLSIDPFDIPTSATDIPSFSTFAPPPPINFIQPSNFVPIGLFIALMRQMYVMIELQARMMAKITQLQANTKRHTTKVATLCGMIAYVQQGV